MPVLENGFDVMAALKAGTADHHRGVERLVPFFNEDFSLESYTAICVAFHGFYVPIEERLSSLDG